MATPEERAGIFQENRERLAPGAPEEVDLFLLVPEGEWWADGAKYTRVPLGKYNLTNLVTDGQLRHTLRTAPDASFSFDFEAGEFRGTLGCDGDIMLHTNLEEAFLWRVLTDLGQTSKVDKVDSFNAVAWMNGFVEDFYKRYGPNPPKENDARNFLYQVSEFYRYEKESRFADGYCSAAPGFWSVACLGLYKEWRKYPYSFMH